MTADARVPCFGHRRAGHAGERLFDWKKFAPSRRLEIVSRRTNATAAIRLPAEMIVA